MPEVVFFRVFMYHHLYQVFFPMDCANFTINKLELKVAANTIEALFPKF